METAIALSTLACRMGNFEMIPMLFFYIVPFVAAAIAVAGLVGGLIFSFVTSK